MIDDAQDINEEIKKAKDARRAKLTESIARSRELKSVLTDVAKKTEVAKQAMLEAESAAVAGNVLMMNSRETLDVLLCDVGFGRTPERGAKEAADETQKCLTRATNSLRFGSVDVGLAVTQMESTTVAAADLLMALTAMEEAPS